MAKNVFETKPRMKRNRTIITKKKNHSKQEKHTKEKEGRYKNILETYKNEKKTNRFLDKRRKSASSKMRKMKKVGLFNLNDSFDYDYGNVPSVDNENMRMEDSGRSISEKPNSDLDEKKNKNRKHMTIQERIEKRMKERKMKDMKNDEIKEKLHTVDSQLDMIRKCVLSGGSVDKKEEKKNKGSHWKDILKEQQKEKDTKEKERYVETNNTEENNGKKEDETMDCEDENLIGENNKVPLADTFYNESDESDNDLVNEFLHKKKKRIANQDDITSNSHIQTWLYNSFLIHPENKKLYDYFVNDVNEEKSKLPFYFLKESKEYYLEDMVELFESYRFKSQKKVLFRIYYMNKLNEKKRKEHIMYSSFIISLMDYFILKIYDCLRKNIRLSECIETYQEILSDLCVKVKREMYLYFSFLVLLLFRDIQKNKKIHDFYKKKKLILEEYIEENKNHRSRTYNVRFYSRILHSVTMFFNLLNKTDESSRFISNLHFASLIAILTVYPILKNKNEVEEDKTNCYEENNRIEPSDDTHQQMNERLLQKIVQIENGNYSTIEQTHPFITFVIEYTEFLFLHFFYEININFHHEKKEELDLGNCEIILEKETYTTMESIEKCMEHIKERFHFTYDMTENEWDDKDINEVEPKKGRVFNHLGFLRNKGELKKAIIHLNIFNILIENTQKISVSFFYLSFKILNTLLYYIIKEENKSEKNSYAFHFSFITFNNMIAFLKKFIMNEINIYIIINHIIIPGTSFLFLHFMKYILKNDGISLNYEKIFHSLENIPIEEDLLRSDFFITSIHMEEEKYLLCLLYAFKLIQYSRSWPIIPIMSKSKRTKSIPFFSPKYVNHETPKDITYLYQSKMQNVELKLAKRKMKQEKKLTYNEVKKENQFIRGLKARVEEERRKRNQEKYKKIKLMAHNDIQEYHKMKTYTHEKRKK